MSFIDYNKFLTSDDPNFFKIGDVLLSVSADNIQVSRHENFQSVSYLRDLHAMKIHTGRSTLRVNVTFPILVDRQLPQLQALVAMTRVTPFIPVQNQFLQGQLKIYDTSPEVFELNRTPDTKSIAKIQKNLAGDALTSAGEPTFLEALPMAIMGMSVVMGGDSPELAECSMSLLFWNPVPWFGIDLQYWKEESIAGLQKDYNRYIKTKINDKAPSTFDSTTFRWWDIKLFSELKERFSTEIEEAITNDDPAETSKAIQQEEKLVPVALNDDFNSYLRYASRNTSEDQLIQGIAAVETDTFGRNAGWSAKNPNTWAAGRYQMTRDTFNGLFIAGNDTIDGVPLKDKVTEVLAGNAALKDTDLNAMLTNNRNTFKTKEAWAKWYARPLMAEMQTFVTKEYLKGLYKKHDNDSVKTSLEYFLGANAAKPYINHWEKYGNVKDWSKADAAELGEHNTNPIGYINKAFGNESLGSLINTPTGLDTEINGGVLTGGISAVNIGSGPVSRNRHGDLLGAGIEPVIPGVVHDRLRELGWKQIALLEDDRPNPNIINPLFQRTEANIIDLSTGNLFGSENQIVTSITISFQNKFASLPVQGWPYPALQHMGSVDSEIRLTIACLSDSQQYNRMQQAQNMLHTMSSRARRYHSDVHDAREILVLSRLACSNKLINMLGINDVVMTDLSVQVDPESPNLARGEIIMSESAFDPKKEKLTASLGKNNRRFRVGLREDWLGKEKYLSSQNSSVVNMGTRLRALQKANDDALSANQDILFESGQLDRVVAQSFNEDDDFRDLVVFTREDEAFYRKQETEIPEFNNIAIKRGLKIQAAKYIPPTSRVLNTFEKIPVPEFRKPHHVVVPINPDLLLSESLGDKIGNLLKSLYDANDTIPGDPTDTDRIKGAASAFLSTSFGVDLMEAWSLMKSQPTTDEFSSAIHKFFSLLVRAIHEWYNREILENMLLFLYRRNESDSTFAQLAAQSRDTPGAGIYKDLLLDRSPLTNPYEWLDHAIEPKILSAMDDAVKAAEQNIDVLLKEYSAMLLDRSDPIRFHGTDATTYAVIQDKSRSIKNDKEGGERAHRTGLSSALSRVGVDATNAALSLRDFSATPFTMRRAFPAYRMYFIEEDNQGIIKRFDDFYNYNAITDIQMIKYKHRPATMIVTMTNLFGHLDAKSFSDMADKEELADAIRANAAIGILPTQIKEENGVETQTAADGTESPLQDIMLKPGTKIVMKLGYDNNPDNLPTTFAGQITEISGGSVITIVCQDWMSEMMVGVKKNEGVDTTGNFWYFLKTLNNSSETRDLQGTSSVRATIGSVMKQRSLAHFGHWQLDKSRRDPNYFGYRRESSFVVKPFENLFGDLLKFFGDGQFEAKSEALINIHPLPQPYYTAFGASAGAVYPTDGDVSHMTLWELIEMQRHLMPNHIAMVRPYGQGDATLYFGPPWGVYVANEFDGEIDSALSDNIINESHRLIFRNMIHNNATITISGMSRFNESRKQRFLRDLFAKVGAAKNDTVEIPIGIVLEVFKKTLAQEADTNIVGAIVESATMTGLGNPAIKAGLSAATKLYSDVLPNEQKTDFNLMPALTSGSSTVIIDKWYDLLMESLRNGGLHDDEDAHAILLNIQSKIHKVMAAWVWLQSRDKEGFDPSGAIQKALKPVRQWHIATAKHHIIANDIQVNNNFANEVRAGDTVVRYDAELTDRRTRFADKEIPKGASDEPHKSLYMASLLSEEMRMMYRGQLILTGNAEIEPYDIIMIFDPTRHMHGAIEVAKVNHIFNQEMGFITIVEPHLIVEQGDYSLSTALAAFFNSVLDDAKENEETVAGKVINRGAAGATLAGVGLMNAMTGPINTLLQSTYVITQMVVPQDARNHPLTIFPLVKRNVPWIGGIEGASGRGVLGIINSKVIRTLKNVRKAIQEISNRVGNVKSASKIISGPSSENPKLGNY